MVDSTLIREIRKAAPNRQENKEKYFSFLKAAKNAAAEMSITTIRRDFNGVAAKYGRAVIAVVIAATLYERRERIDFWNFQWANEVLQNWSYPGKTDGGVSIRDGIHPTAICDYAADFIKLNAE